MNHFDFEQIKLFDFPIMLFKIDGLKIQLQIL